MEHVDQVTGKHVLGITSENVGVVSGEKAGLIFACFHFISNANSR